MKLKYVLVFLASIISFSTHAELMQKQVDEIILRFKELSEKSLELITKFKKDKNLVLSYDDCITLQKFFSLTKESPEATLEQKIIIQELKEILRKSSIRYNIATK